MHGHQLGKESRHLVFKFGRTVFSLDNSFTCCHEICQVPTQTVVVCILSEEPFSCPVKFISQQIVFCAIRLNKITGHLRYKDAASYYLTEGEVVFLFMPKKADIHRDTAILLREIKNSQDWTNLVAQW